MSTAFVQNRGSWAEWPPSVVVRADPANIGVLVGADGASERPAALLHFVHENILHKKLK